MDIPPSGIVRQRVPSLRSSRAIEFEVRQCPDISTFKHEGYSLEITPLLVAFSSDSAVLLD